MSCAFKYRFVDVVLLFTGTQARFEVGHPVNACFSAPDEVHHAINAALSN
jgi:hypothetical protein